MTYGIPPGVRVYAVGDIHGRADLLDEMLERIAADAADSPEPDRRLVLLGDYVDRGPSSRRVLDRLCDGRWTGGFTVTCLRGNHDEAMRRALARPEHLLAWLPWGAGPTLASYGIGDVERRSVAPGGLADLHAEFLAAVPDAHRRFLERLPLSARVGGYFFVHAGVRPGVPLDAQEPHDLLWIRDEFLDSPADHGAVVVHGHTIYPAPEDRANRIGLDTGACATGRLTAVVLSGTDRRFLEVGNGSRPALLRRLPLVGRILAAVDA